MLLKRGEKFAKCSICGNLREVPPSEFGKFQAADIQKPVISITLKPGVFKLTTSFPPFYYFEGVSDFAVRFRGNLKAWEIGIRIDKETRIQAKNTDLGLVGYINAYTLLYSKD